MEDAASRRRRRDAHALGVEDRVEAGDCLAGLALLRDDGERIVLRARENISRFREGDPAMLGEGMNPLRGLAVSVVDEDPVAGILTLERDAFSRDEPLPGNGPFVLDRRDLSTGDRLARGVAQALDGRAPAGAVPARLLAGEPLREPGREEQSAARALAASADLDPSQREAFARALAADPVHLVQGPPGSGKTRLLAALIRAFVARGERILVTAFTHQAINNVLRALGGDASGLPCRTIKMGSDAPGGELARLGVEVRRQGRAIPNPRGPLVAGATVYGAHRLWGAVPFDRVVIDEAAQVPLAHGVLALGSAPRATLVGDHRQMGPIVLADPPHPLAPVSIFEHLQARYGATMLETTYRMNAAINGFVSRHFYGGRLRPDASCASRRLRLGPGGALHEILDPDRPAVLVTIDHEGCRTRSRPEADLAACLALELMAHHGVSWEEIAVIAPYRAQVNAIRRAFRTRAAGAAMAPDREPLIDTVERIQGQERDVIIASFTASDPDLLARDASFFFSPNRLNVLLSRARVKRILIASPRAFRAIPRALDDLRNASLFRRLYDESDRIEWRTPDG
jgi:DNA replication ATP-dependent helicase Dna2